MKVVIQRVASATVSVAGKNINSIGMGLLILLGVDQGDLEKDIDYLAGKTVGLRIFKDNKNNMNLSVKDIGGEVMVVSQFTLCANTKRGHRPSFINAAHPKLAEYMYDQYCQKLHMLGVSVSKGQFGATMDVELINNGPMTIVLDSRA